jgi:hypothetical protein
MDTGNKLSSMNTGRKPMTLCPTEAAMKRALLPDAESYMMHRMNGGNERTDSQSNELNK